MLFAPVEGRTRKQEVVSSMFPPKRDKPVPRNFNISIPEELVLALDAIVGELKASLRSRNGLIAYLLTFGEELFRLQKPLAKQIEEFKQRESERLGKELSEAQVWALLAERGLKASKK
jgi:isopropylmalate/homocitrate/citramalate synthase